MTLTFRRGILAEDLNWESPAGDGIVTPKENA